MAFIAPQSATSGIPCDAQYEPLYAGFLNIWGQLVTGRFQLGTKHSASYCTPASFAPWKACHIALLQWGSILLAKLRSPVPESEEFRRACWVHCSLGGRHPFRWQLGLFRRGITVSSLGHSCWSGCEANSGYAC